MGQTQERVIYVDGFAGAGKYGDGEEGSPLIAYKTAINHKLKEKFIAQIVLKFFEKDAATKATLERNLEEIRNQNNVEGGS